MKVKTLIVDDEPMARGVIRKHTGHFDMFEIIAECQNAIETINILNTQEIDLIFLDINMPQITGLELLSSLKNPPLVVITTAYSEFGVKSYEYSNIIDYLLKPITFERFIKTVDKIKTKFKNTLEEKQVSSLVSEEIKFKSNKTTVQLMPEKIFYLQAFGNYVKVFVQKRGMILVQQKLQDFEDQLPSEIFIRCHKSYIVNKNHITKLLKNEIEIQNTTIPIGITYRQNLNKIKV
ncbi:LytT Response regulator of the LytR/AlgR family [Spirosomataceae bacterium]|jgi:DNA-binding LytR/AlgR family response regulator